MLTDPEVDPDQKVNVDGIEVTMGNLKTMIEIEDRIQEIAESFLLPEDMDEQHRAEYDSIMNQLQTDGIELLEDETSVSGPQNETAGTEGETSAADTQGVTYDHEARISYDSSIDTQNAAGMVSVTFTQPALEYETSFDWRTADGDAKAGTNYTAASGTVTFAPGETSRTVDIAILEDVRNWNGNQSFYIEVDNAKNILFSNGESSGSININIRKSYDFSAWKSSPGWKQMNVSCGAAAHLPNGWDEDYTYGTSPESFQPGQNQVTVTFNRELTAADKDALADGQITDMSVSSYMMWHEERLMYASVRITNENGRVIAQSEASCSESDAASASNKLGGGTRTTVSYTHLTLPTT